MHIEIITNFTGLAGVLATELSLEGRFTVGHTPAKVEACVMRVPTALRSTDLADLIGKLAPFEVAVFRTPGLPADRIELELGGPRGLACDVKVFGGETDFTTKVAEDLRRLGFEKVSISDGAAGGNRVVYGGAGLFALAVVDTGLRRLGCRPRRIKEWSDGDRDVYIQVEPPLVLDRTTRASISVSVRTDAADMAPRVIEAVRALGFASVRLEITDVPAAEARIGVSPGILESGGDDCAVAGLMAICDQFSAEAGINPQAYPVKRLPTERARKSPILHLPLRKILSGLAAPYAGSWPARYEVRVCTDDRPTGLGLTSAFSGKGFAAVSKRMDHDLSHGFAIRGRAVSDDPAICEVVREVLEREMVAQDILDAGISFLPGAEGNTI